MPPPEPALDVEHEHVRVLRVRFLGPVPRNYLAARHADLAAPHLEGTVIVDPAGSLPARVESVDSESAHIQAVDGRRPVTPRSLVPTA